MNATIADFNRDGNSDIYIQKVSNGLAKQATLKISQRNIEGYDIVDTNQLFVYHCSPLELQ